MTQDGIEGLPYICLSDVSGAMEVAERAERARIVEYLRSEADGYGRSTGSVEVLKPPQEWLHAIVHRIEDNEF